MKNKLAALIKRKDYYEKLLQRIKNNSDAVPTLEREYERTKWEIDSLENLPEEASDFPTDHILENIDAENEYLFQSVPLPLIIDHENLYLMSTTSGSASSDLFEMVTRVGEFDSPITKRYSLDLSDSYKEFQKKYDLVEENNQYLSQLQFIDTQKRFKDAFDLLQKSKNEIVTKTSAAIEMRTFLDGLKGNIFQFVRNRPKENMTWDRLAIRFSEDNKYPFINKTIHENSRKFSSLYFRLSEIGKGRIKATIVDLESIWVEVLDLTNSLLKNAIAYHNNHPMRK